MHDTEITCDQSIQMNYKKRRGIYNGMQNKPSE